MKEVLVVGDSILDCYVFGDVSRVSPEAPVAVLDYKHRSEALGGACNVACNIKSLLNESTDISVSYAGYTDAVVGDLLKLHSINTSYCEKIESAEVLKKTRFVCSNQHMLRVDENKSYKKSLNFQNNLEHYIEDLKPDLIIISDYNKGTLTRSIWDTLLGCNVPCLIDLKRKYDFFKDFSFKNCTIKCNKKEFEDNSDILHLDYKNLVVTLGNEGYEIFVKQSGSKVYPAHQVKNLKDVTGAGDSFLAGMAVEFIENEKATIESMCEFANLAASEKVSNFGTTAVRRGSLNV